MFGFLRLQPETARQSHPKFRSLVSFVRHTHTHSPSRGERGGEGGRRFSGFSEGFRHRQVSAGKFLSKRNFDFRIRRRKAGGSSSSPSCSEVAHFAEPPTLLPSPLSTGNLIKARQKVVGVRYSCKYFRWGMDARDSFPLRPSLPSSLPPPPFSSPCLATAFRKFSRF